MSAGFEDFMAAVIGIQFPLVVVLLQELHSQGKQLKWMNQQWWDSKQRCCVCGHWGFSHDVQRHAELDAKIRRVGGQQ